MKNNKTMILSTLLCLLPILLTVALYDQLPEQVPRAEPPSLWGLCLTMSSISWGVVTCLVIDNI